MPASPGPRSTAAAAAPRAEGDLRRGDGAGRRPADRQHARPDLPRPRPSWRSAPTQQKTRDHPAAAAQRRHLVPGLLRARRRLRPRRAATRARAQGDQYVVNGQKVWTTNAMHADRMFALVRTEPECPAHRGISMLLHRHARRRCRGPPAEADDRQRGVRRGLPHRREGAQGAGARRGRLAAGTSPCCCCRSSAARRRWASTPRSARELDEIASRPADPRAPDRRRGPGDPAADRPAAHRARGAASCTRCTS